MTTASPAAGTANITDPTKIATVGIVGFGTMGSGIAQVCALAGKNVLVAEKSQQQIDHDMAAIGKHLDRSVEKGRLDQAQRDAAFAAITPSQDLGDILGADLIIEAVTERLDVKQAIFTELDAGTPETTILATNTSALSVTEIAAVTKHPGRVCGLHFFNPAPVLPLVEVVRAERTEQQVIATAMEFVRSIGKDPISCGDTPGFVVNRILIPTLNDAIQLFGDGLASAADIDKGCKLGLNWPIGPLALADMIGLDVAVHAAEALWEAYREPRFCPPPLLVRMVKAGKLGRKTGEGFYSYKS